MRLEKLHDCLQCDTLARAVLCQSSQGGAQPTASHWWTALMKQMDMATEWPAPCNHNQVELFHQSQCEVKYTVHQLHRDKLDEEAPDVRRSECQWWMSLLLKLNTL